MRPFLTAVVLSLTCLVAAACSSERALQKFSSPEDRALSEQIIAAIQRGDGGVIVAYLPPSIAPQLTQELPKMRAAVPSGPGTRVTLADTRFTVRSATGEPTTRNSYLAYEVDGGGRFSIVRLGIERQGGQVRITDLYANALAAPARELSAFKLGGKRPAQYIVLALTMVSVATILAALVLLWRDRTRRRRWLWAIGCLFGLAQVAVNWTSGEVSFTLLNIQLFGAFALKDGMLGDWRVGFGVPVFALALLLAAAFEHGGRKPPAQRDATPPAVEP